MNLGAADLERECRLLQRKIRTGADFALAMPTYSADVLRIFRKSYEERYGMLRLPILVGVLPLVTSRHAEFLHNELARRVDPGRHPQADARSDEASVAHGTGRSRSSWRRN